MPPASLALGPALTIPPEREAEILRLAQAEGLRPGTISRLLGHHHDVVERVLASPAQPKSKPAPPAALVDPYLPFLQGVVAKYPRIPSSALWRMACDRGYPGAEGHFRRIVRTRIRPPKSPEAFLRLRSLPGEEAQVDWAHFGHIRIGKAERLLTAFVVVLSHSRAIFLRFYPTASMAAFLHGHAEAFATFGGVPRVLLYDNLKSAVLERQGDAIRFNPRLLDLAKHHRFEARPVGVARGNEKGRVERAIRYVRDNFWPGRSWSSLDDLNAQATAWAQGTAMQRAWVEDRERTVAQAFAEEQAKLLPLPQEPFPAWEATPVRSGKSPYVRFDGNDYSIPHQAVQRSLLLQATLDEVLVLDGPTLLARHPRSFDKGAQIEEAAHIQALVEWKSKARKGRGLQVLAKALAHQDAFVQGAAERGHPLGPLVSRLLTLLDQHGPARLDEALAEVVASGACHLGALHTALALKASKGREAPKAPLDLSHLPLEVRSLRVQDHPLASFDRAIPPSELRP